MRASGKAMTSKERMLIAMQNGMPDRVPVAPDISNMIPCRLTGKPFWKVYREQDPPLWKAYIEAIKYFGIDGWFTYGDLSFKTDSRVSSRKEIVKQDKERIIERTYFDTPDGQLREEFTYYVADSPTLTERKIKSLVEDFPKVRHLYPEILGYNDDKLTVMRGELGDLGVLGIPLRFPGFQNWLKLFDGGLESLTCAFYDHSDIMEELTEMEENYSIRQMELILAARPDFVLFAGSGTITLQSPSLFRRFGLPSLKKMTKMAKEAGIPTMLHSCGKERILVEICVEETGLDCINPLEVPPMGDCDLAEIKAKFGKDISLMGNLNTVEVMLRGTVDDVEREARKAIDDAGAGGGFILSTGDQCGRDTPDENIFKLVETARTYGKY